MALTWLTARTASAVSRPQPPAPTISKGRRVTDLLRLAVWPWLEHRVQHTVLLGFGHDVKQRQDDRVSGESLGNRQGLMGLSFVGGLEVGGHDASAGRDTAFQERSQKLIAACRRWLGEKNPRTTGSSLCRRAGQLL